MPLPEIETPEVNDDMQWFRHDNRMRHDPKIRALNHEAFRLWNALLEMASEQQLQGVVQFLPGVPYTDEQLADEAKVSVQSVRMSIQTMQQFRMVEERSDGLFVVNFAKHQYLSDSSTERVKKFRDKQRSTHADETAMKRFTNVGVTPPDTDTDTDTDTEEDNNVGSDEPTTSTDGYSADFLKFWDAYPRKVGKKGAFSCWRTRLKQGAKASDLITSCSHYKAHCEGKEERFILHPSTFLGPNDRWRDYLDPASAKPEATRQVSYQGRAPATPPATGNTPTYDPEAILGRR